jgi:hypothetical protein
VAVVRDSEIQARGVGVGTLSGGNGGGWPPDGLPDLPPEWGTIVIPDDASELAREATRVQRELRRQRRGRTWRRILHLPPRSPAGDGTALGVPLLVISIAIIATLTSLFAIAWPTRTSRPDLVPSAVATTPAANAPVTDPAATGPAAGSSTGAMTAPSDDAAAPDAPTTARPDAVGPAG